ncbi:Anaerobic dimethyl sulfoxide reductase chain B [Moorella humiferrea]
MPKVIAINQERCNGCQLCQIGCMAQKTGRAGLQISRIRVDKRVDKLAEGGFVALTCNHCDEPVCATACLMEAITKGEDGVTLRNESLCIGCQACVIVCPWGAVVLDPDRDVAVSCDLCSGEPYCVDICPTGALQLASPKDISMKKRQFAAERIALSGPNTSAAVL